MGRQNHRMLPSDSPIVFIFMTSLLCLHRTTEPQYGFLQHVMLSCAIVAHAHVSLFGNIPAPEARR
jgi:hypothetical protein